MFARQNPVHTTVPHRAQPLVRPQNAGHSVRNAISAHATLSSNRHCETIPPTVHESSISRLRLSGRYPIRTGRTTRQRKLISHPPAESFANRIQPRTTHSKGSRSADPVNDRSHGETLQTTANNEAAKRMMMCFPRANNGGQPVQQGGRSPLVRSRAVERGRCSAAVTSA